jgi:hypothetical protein
VGIVYHNIVPIMLLYGVHTTYGCSGAVKHGYNVGLCIILTCSWCVANFGFEKNVPMRLKAFDGLLAIPEADGGATVSANQPLTEEFNSQYVSREDFNTLQEEFNDFKQLVIGKVFNLTAPCTLEHHCTAAPLSQFELITKSCIVITRR